MKKTITIPAPISKIAKIAGDIVNQVAVLWRIIYSKRLRPIFIEIDNITLYKREYNNNDSFRKFIDVIPPISQTLHFLQIFPMAVLLLILHWLLWYISLALEMLLFDVPSKALWFVNSEIIVSFEDVPVKLYVTLLYYLSIVHEDQSKHLSSTSCYQY